MTTSTAEQSRPSRRRIGLGGLRYITSDMPGYRRVRRKDHIAYIDPEGNELTDEEELARIRALAIPPAWQNVWISLDPRGHLQATGRDAKGRKQYRYHPLWRKARDETKFGNMVAFGEALPRLRRRVQKDLERRGLPREKVVAIVIRLLDVTGIRIGSIQYARENQSYGLTTMRNRHARVNTNGVVFAFKGKSGKFRRIGVHDARLARLVLRCKEIPGYELFQYLDDGERRAITSDDVNGYIHEAAGAEFTAKDFRTWWGTVLAAATLHKLGPTRSQTQAKKQANKAIRHVAETLGNTVAVCRKSYVHPAVIEAYQAGVTIRPKRPSKWLTADERATLALLRGRG